MQASACMCVSFGMHARRAAASMIDHNHAYVRMVFIGQLGHVCMRGQVRQHEAAGKGAQLSSDRCDDR